VNGKKVFSKKVADRGYKVEVAQTKNDHESIYKDIVAKHKSDFDKAVQAEVAIQIRKYEAGLAMGESFGKAQSDRMDKEIRAGERPGFNNFKGAKLPTEAQRYFDRQIDAIKAFPIPKAMTGQPTRTFHSLTSEAMSHISDLQTVVENLIEQLSPVMRPKYPTGPSDTQKGEPVQAGSEFTEFVDCVGRRCDTIRESVAETISRLSI
jgi:hypothetical protein